MIRVLFSLLVMLQPHLADAGCALTMRVTDSAPRFYQQNGVWKGLQVELASLLMEVAQCELKLKKLHWNRALFMLEKGQLDFMAEMSITEERKAYLNFIGPESDETMVIIVRKDSQYEINSLDDIKSIAGFLGLGQNTWYGEAMDHKIKNDPEFASKIAYEASGSKIQGERVIRGYIFGYVDNRYPWAYRIKHDPLYQNKLKIHDFIVNQSFNYWGFSKQTVDQAMLRRLQAAYDHIKMRGGFNTILQRYR